jgi:hypothetical protein
MTNSEYLRPSTHRTLRALLRTIERANAQGDIDALKDAYDLAEELTENGGLVMEYINGLSERLRDGEYRAYFMYTDQDLDNIKNDLEKEGFGDFDEAMEILEYDLNSIDRYRSIDDMESRVFRPELFEDDDRAIWNTLWANAKSYFDDNKSDTADNCLGESIMKIRSYQQKSHGPLILTLTASYRTKEAGVSVCLAWYDDRAHVITHAPFAAELEEYFTSISPVNVVSDFKPECFPANVGEYKLGSISRNSLFRYEL